MGKPEREIQGYPHISVDAVGARSTTHLVRLLLDFDNMLPQFLTILNPRFSLEEVFSLGIQYQKTGVGWESAKVRFDFAVAVHNGRLFDPREGKSSGLGGNCLVYRFNDGARCFGRGPAVGGFSALCNQL